LKYKKYPKEEKSNEKNFFYERNLDNLNAGFPFYVLRKGSLLFFDAPNYSIPNKYRVLKFGDVLYPLKSGKQINNFFYVKTIDGKIGWINVSSGISLNFNDDDNLYYFNEEYYLKRYKESKGAVSNSDIVVLIKNVVPMLLENFKTEGWFFSGDYDLALELSSYAVSIAKDQDTFFHSASSYDWRVNEIVITNNLLSDCYHKMKMFDKAIEIHEKLLRSYFWRRSDNSQIGGLNSSVKLTKIYSDKLKDFEPESPEYKKIRSKMIDAILITGDSYNIYTVMDKEWHLSAAEWLMVILENNLPLEEFYSVCNLLMKKTVSKGFADLVLIYKAVSMYKDGKRDEAFKIIKQINSKDMHLRSGKIENWIKDNKIIPDSSLYQYKF